MEDVINRACDTYWDEDKCMVLVERPLKDIGEDTRIILK
jgi:hypothetical protein